MRLARLCLPLPLVVAAIVGTFYCWTAAAVAAPKSSDAPTLNPIHIDDYETASGHVRRSEGDGFDQLHPHDKSHLAFGAPVGESTFNFRSEFVCCGRGNRTAANSRTRFECCFFRWQWKDAHRKHDPQSSRRLEACHPGAFRKSDVENRMQIRRLGLTYIQHQGGLRVCEKGVVVCERP